MDWLEKYAKENHIPIMQKEGIEFLTHYIKKNNIYNILEIGSAIGYSSINMALVDPKIKIVTIERDETLYNEALKNIQKFNLSRQITVINKDALDVHIDGKFDLIFIDAAKAQYIKFFEKFQNNLNSNGVIIADNLNFHGLTKKPDTIKSKNLRALVRKINKYKEYLKYNPNYKTLFLDIGDGISITKHITVSDKQLKN